MHFRRIAIWLALFSLPLAAKTWSRTFAVHGQPALHVSTDNAAITVQAWSRAEVQVQVVSRAWGSSSDQFNAEASQSGNLISVLVRTPHHFFSFGGESIHITVETPSPARLALHSSNGAIHVMDVAGELELSTSNGSIHARHAGGEVRATSSNGSVHLDGRIQTLLARTSNGSIHIVAQPGSSVSSRWTLTSGNGSIHLQLPSDLSAQVEAHTGLGSIHCGLPLHGSQAVGHIGRHELHGTLNRGGPVIALRSGNGSISIN